MSLVGSVVIDKVSEKELVVVLKEEDIADDVTVLFDIDGNPISLYEYTLEETDVDVERDDIVYGCAYAESIDIQDLDNISSEELDHIVRTKTKYSFPESRLVSIEASGKL